MQWSDLALISGVGVGSSTAIEALVPSSWKKWLRVLLSITAPSAASVSLAGTQDFTNQETVLAALAAAGLSQAWHHIVARQTAIGYVEDVFNAVLHGRNPPTYEEYEKAHHLPPA